MTPAAFRCRSCGAGGTVPVLSLGTTPLANALLRADDLDHPEPAYPLELVFCPACTLVQITESVAPEALFRDYVYFSSYSDTMVEHARALATRLCDERLLCDVRTVAERELPALARALALAATEGDVIT